MSGDAALLCLAIVWLTAGYTLLFSWPLCRRPHFACRVAACFAAGVVLAVLFREIIQPWSLRMLLLALYALFCMSFWCDQPPAASLYGTIWSLMSMQFLSQLYMGLVGFALLGGGLSALWLSYLLFAALCAVPVYFLIARGLPIHGRNPCGPRQTSSAVGLFLLFELISDILFGDSALAALLPAVFAENRPLLLLCEFYCLTVLYLQSALFRKSAMQQELTALDLLLHQQKEQYNLAKENIALINRKCHDLKHQVRALRDMADNDQRRRYLDEIDDSIRIYDAIVKTGSEVLDTILTEKSLRCKEKNIAINCVADGSRIGFLDPVDAYTIFGNALDNAMEEVQKFTEAEKRQVDVLIHVKGQFLVISIINPLTEPPTFQDGLPQTTKDMSGYHGFGVKSIQHTVKKYGGHFTIRIENDCFVLKIIFPLPDLPPAPAQGYK